MDTICHREQQWNRGPKILEWLGKLGSIDDKDRIIHAWAIVQGVKVRAKAFSAADTILKKMGSYERTYCPTGRQLDMN